MNDDRELLELAAKAAGLNMVEYNGITARVELPERNHGDGWVSGGNVPWNPLTDDGDALRLAVKLKITPHIDGNLTDCEGCTEAHLGDPYAATRRAIVRAAAEIGRQHD